MITLLDYRVSLSYLAYLGYPGNDTTSALKVTKPRTGYERARGKINRQVFLAYMFGAPGSGKTSLIKSFVKKEFSAAYVPTKKLFSAVNSVEIGGSEKYLVVQFINSVRGIWKCRSGDTKQQKEDGAM
jgi:Ras family protein T1